MVTKSEKSQIKVYLSLVGFRIIQKITSGIGKMLFLLCIVFYPASALIRGRGRVGVGLGLNDK